MVKKKPTKKEFETVISTLINHVHVIEEKLGALDSLFGLYLEWNKDKDKFNKFVELTFKETTESIVENEPGESK